MLFVSVDGELKRVAHTSGVIEMIGKTPVNLPVLETNEKGEEVGYKGLLECAMLAGCIPFDGKASKATKPGYDAAKLDGEKADFEKEKAAFEKEKADFEALKSVPPVPAVDAAPEAKPAQAPKAAKASVIIE